MQENYFKRLWTLIITFFKIGILTFGGGYVMLAIIRDEFVEKRDWISDDELLQVYAIAESTPGPVAINAATYIGNKTCGTLGAILATVFEVMPAFVITFVIATYLNHIMDYPIVQNAFKGIKAGVAILILYAGVDMFRKMEKTSFNLTVAIISFVLMALIDVFAIDFSSIWIILFFGVLSLAIFSVKNHKEKTSQKANSLDNADKEKNLAENEGKEDRE